MNILHMYSDGQHGWLKVKKSVLNDLNISHLITRCSYQRGEYAYLEEDCDLSTFLKAYYKGNIPPQWWTIDLKIKSHHSNKSSKIRSYERYSK